MNKLQSTGLHKRLHYKVHSVQKILQSIALLSLPISSSLCLADNDCGRKLVWNF